MHRSAAPAISVVALSCLGLAFAPASVIHCLAFDRQAIIAGQIWRLWTGHVVHFSAQHALVDTTVLFMLGALVEKEIGARRLSLALLLGAPIISMGLIVTVPGLQFYRGASGIATMAAILAGVLLWTTSAASRMILAFLAVGLVIKTVCEAFGISVGLSSLPQNVAITWQAHVLGAICGALMAFLNRSPTIHCYGSPTLPSPARR